MKRILSRGAAVAALFTGLVGCAGSTFNSGVGDRLLARPPYYAGSGQLPNGACLAHLPVAYEADAIFDPAGGAGSPVAALLEAMNVRLAALRPHGVALPAPDVGTPPDVRFGCETDAGGECVRNDDPADRDAPRMRLAVGRPSGPWVREMQAALDSVAASGVLVVTLELGQYWPHQKNVRGDKEVRLGSDYIVALPWLTSLDAPVSVLQLTGALVDRDGRALRIGAEGLVARPTNLVLSSFGVQRRIADEEVARLLESVRDDLPGAPPTWTVALDSLVRRLVVGQITAGSCAHEEGT